MKGLKLVVAGIAIVFAVSMLFTASALADERQDIDGLFEGIDIGIEYDPSGSIDKDCAYGEAIRLALCPSIFDDRPPVAEIDLSFFERRAIMSAAFNRCLLLDAVQLFDSSAEHEFSELEDVGSSFDVGLVDLDADRKDICDRLDG